jgi:hypothetical protein
MPPPRRNRGDPEEPKSRTARSKLWAGLTSDRLRAAAGLARAIVMVVWVLHGGGDLS